MNHSTGTKACEWFRGATSKLLRPSAAAAGESRTARRERAGANFARRFEATTLPIAFGNQTFSGPSASANALRLTALRPYLAIGLPLSCAIIVLGKNSLGRLRSGEASIH